MRVTPSWSFAPATFSTWWCRFARRDRSPASPCSPVDDGWLDAHRGRYSHRGRDRSRFLGAHGFRRRQPASSCSRRWWFLRRHRNPMKVIGPTMLGGPLTTYASLGHSRGGPVSRRYSTNCRIAFVDCER
jgi:hypothetical protein